MPRVRILRWEERRSTEKRGSNDVFSGPPFPTVERCADDDCNPCTSYIPYIIVVIPRSDFHLHLHDPIEF